MMNLGQLINKEFGGQTPTTAYVKANTGKKKKKSTGIKDDELITMLQDLKENFSGRFANADLGELCVKWGLTNRQTPSRLRKLAEQGLLERFDTKPLSYEVK